MIGTTVDKARHNFRSNSSQKTLVSSEKRYDQWFDRLVSMENPKIIRRANCKICILPPEVREMAESYWEKCHNQSLVRDKLNKWSKEEDVGITFNQLNVRSHMQNHYAQQERQMWLEDYSARMQSMMSYKVSRDQMFEGLSTSLQVQFMDIAAHPTMDKNKQTNAMTQLARILMDIAETQSKIRSDLKSAEIVADKFKKIWVEMATKQDDPAVQQLLLENLDMFRQEMSEINVET